MYKIFLLMLVLSVCGDGGYRKYIDLLPEEEKQEFLNRIARRILENIKNDEVPNQSHVEITDDQLETHDAYVQDIIQEETKQIKDERRQINTEKLEEPLEDNGEDREHIDLTLRNGKRLKRKNGDLNIDTTTQFDYSVIPIRTTYDDINEKNKEFNRPSNKEIDENISTTIKHEINDTIDEDENKKGTSIPPNLLPLSTNSTDANNSQRKSFRNKLLEENISINLNASYEENSTQKEDFNGITSKDNINFTTNSDFYNVSFRISDEKNILRQDKESKTSETLGNILTTETDFDKTVNKKEEETLSIEVTTPKDKVEATEAMTESDLVNNKKQFQNSGVDDSKNVTIINSTISISDSTTESSSQTASLPVPVFRANNSVNITSSNKTSNLEAKSQGTHNDVNFTTTRKSEDITKTEVNKEHVSNEGINKSRPSLRLQLKNVKSDPHVHEKSGKIKEYEVYEVAAEKPPFSLRNDRSNEQLYKVPVYNYDSENAYFRPYDRFGPNTEYLKYENLDDKDDDDGNDKTDNIHKINTRSRFTGYNKKQNVQEFKYPIKRGNSKIYGFMQPVRMKFLNHKIIYNPYDYLDIDYDYNKNDKSFSRKSKHYFNKRQRVNAFPDSHEDDHIYNSLNKNGSVKDHVRAVRKLLYLQKLFGYVPDISEKVRKFALFTRSPQLNEHRTILKEPLSNSISADYYFERAHLNKSKAKILDDKLGKEIELRNWIFFDPVKTAKYQKRFKVLDPILNVNNQKRILKPSDRKRDNDEFNVMFNSMLEVLQDMIRFENEGLVNYSWLRTAVDIQTAIRKLLDLCEGLLYGEDLHPKDLELLKYNLYLYKSSKLLAFNESGKEEIKDDLRIKKHKKGSLPKNRYKQIIKQPLKLWKDFAKFIRNIDYNKDQSLKILYDFEDFLQSTLFNLNEFHEAVKNIALVTKYKDQAWFNDLKNIYLNNCNRKQLIKVLLHISLMHLLENIEENAVSGAEVDFRKFLENNGERVRRTKKDFVFVLRVLDVLNRINV